MLTAPFLTRNNISALYRRLERSPGLRAILGLASVPSKARISIYKNHLLSARFFCLLRMHLLHRLKRQGQLSLKKIIIDGAPLWAYMNQINRTARRKIPRELIRRTFQEINLTWTDIYYPIRAARQIPTSVIVSYYLLMYWLGIRSLGALLGWLKRFPDILKDAGLPKKIVSKNVFGTFQDRFRRFLQDKYGDRAPFRSLDALIRTVCLEAQHSFFFIIVLQLDKLRTNTYLFNLFRYQRRVGDPDAMYGYCDSRKTIVLGYRLIFLSEEGTKLPLFGIVVPANQNEHTSASPMLDDFIQFFSSIETPVFPPKTTMFADLAYNRRQIHSWADQHQIRLLLTDRHNLPSSTVYRRAKHRIRIEQTFSDLTEFLGLNHPRTLTLPYVQTFVEIIFCARVIQAVIALVEGHKDFITLPSYPAFGR